ncbi:hypothetical protein VFPBJ_01677 [Purpureocillium lilacinum]|uniref:Uncharacterized protein n=1 Tax=Purpureocillium lilacinum TaxID=33203 RepID=A0A179HBQ7_PURLI|nr:hypothetical protein VFPBJ_01677 [Purpureocillium lilacinum]
MIEWLRNYALAAHEYWSTQVSYFPLAPGRTKKSPQHQPVCTSTHPQQHHHQPTARNQTTKTNKRNDTPSFLRSPGLASPGLARAEACLFRPGPPSCLVIGNCKARACQV